MTTKTGIKAGPDFQVGDTTLTIDEDGFIQEPEREMDFVLPDGTKITAISK
jgi:hypothetical protein